MGLNQNIVDNYGNILEKMPIENSNLLENGLAQMKICAVKEFAYRRIARTGESTIFATSPRWHGMNKDHKFFCCMSEHINAEILYLKDNNLNFFTRSDDKMNTPYLQYLEGCGVNSSVVSFKFDQEKIELFYFITDPNRAEYRDLVLNNLSHLDNIVRLMQPVLKFFSRSLELQNQKECLLDNSTILRLWKDDYSRSNCRRKFEELIYRQKRFVLSSQEFKCLLLLKLGWGNKSIGLKLNISELTVKDYVASLKKKFAVQSRDDLTEIAQSGKIRYLNQLAEII